jgi:acyl-CoA synthetase (AMP-forming)/AMP-acid ligase II/acetyltransferase-like isoleucine patch superfamily enzyme
MQTLNVEETLGPVFHPDSGRPYQRPESRCLHQLLNDRAARNPNGIAIEAPGRKALTYQGLLQQAGATREALRSFGVGRNDRVAVVLPNGPEMAACFVAVAGAAACAPLNPSYKAEEFDFYLADLNARALIIAAGMESVARDVARQRNIAVIELKADLENGAGVFELAGPTAKSANSDGAAQPQDIALVLHTSGTTSRPKIVPLSHANVCSSGHNIALTLSLTEADRCLNVMPLFHIHGLIGALLSSLTAGAGVICSPGFEQQDFFDWLDKHEPTWYTAVPTIHQAVLARASTQQEIIARRPLRLIRSSSASLPPPVMEELERVFQTQVIESYGMTEASHQMTSNPLAPLARKAGSVGMAAGPDVAIMDNDGNLLPVGEVGEVVIAGPNVTGGYENNPAANEAAFTNGWFRTGDQGRFDTEGYLFLTGRLKEIINRGGEKIAPREVDEVLLQHPSVGQAVTFAVPHPTLGEDVAAAVVLKKGSHATENELRELAAAHLAEFKVPRQVLFLDEVPKGPTGKLQRIGLADKLADKLAAKQQANFLAAQTSPEKDLAEIWQRLLNTGQLGVRHDFFALGGDSLRLTSMIREVESRFSTEIPLAGFLASPTIENLTRLIDQKDSHGAGAGQASGRPLVTDSGLRGLKNRLLQVIALYAPGFKTTRVWLHRQRGVTIGNNVSIGQGALIETAYPSLVSLGNNVSLGIRSTIIAHLRDSTLRSRYSNEPTVRIEDDVYIGPGVIVLPNVTIGRGAVVSAGSVVSSSIPPKTLVRGNPAEPVARCGVSLGGGVSYEEFLRHLTPLNDKQGS